jgi:acyl-CoA carboxylase epsilon subunit
VSGTNAVSDENETNPDHQHEPHIRVLKGEPTDEELAALIAVLGSARGGAPDRGEPEHNRWGLPVDKLRYPVFSWQKITLVERTHMRRI